MAGSRRRVRRVDGPERIFGEWWKRDAEMIAVRDYFQVEDDAGERYWIFRAGDGEDAATGSHKTLVDWLRRQPDTELQRLNVERAAIREREFYPRVSALSIRAGNNRE